MVDQFCSGVYFSTRFSLFNVLLWGSQFKTIIKYTTFQPGIDLFGGEGHHQGKFLTNFFCFLIYSLLFTHIRVYLLFKNFYRRMGYWIVINDEPWRVEERIWLGRLFWNLICRFFAIFFGLFCPFLKIFQSLCMPFLFFHSGFFIFLNYFRVWRFERVYLLNFKLDNRN